MPTLPARRASITSLLPRITRHTCWLALFLALPLGLVARPAASSPAAPRTQVADGAWNELIPPSILSGREAMTGFYDGARSRLVVVCGWDASLAMNEVWTLSLTGPARWTLQHPTGTAPAGRYAHSMVYDSARDRLIVFGGRDASPTPFGDAWALDLSGPLAWTQLTPAGAAPTARFGHEAVYDPVRDRMIVFGGYDGAFQNDTWALSFAGTPTWTQLTPAGTPPSTRDFPTLVYDPVADRVVMFGGNELNGGPVQPTADTWQLTLAGTPAWSLLATAGSAPSPRLLHKSFYDPVRGRLVLMGGTNSASWFNDVYALTLTGVPTWTHILPGGPLPALRSDHVFVYDAAADRALVFGGRNGATNAFFNDTDALNLAGAPTWTPLAIASDNPSVRLLHKSAYDPATNQLYMFGGTDATTWLNDTWRLSMTGVPQWTRLHDGTGVAPARRSDHVTVFDAPRNRLIVFGGRDPVSFYNDVWAFDVAAGAWSQLFPAGTPPSQREAMAGMLDAARNRMLFVGGWDGANALNDVWTLSLTGPPTWTNLATAGSPPNGRYAHSIIYDSHRDRVLIFGGRDAVFGYTDVWALNLSGVPTWTPVATTGSLPFSYLFGHEAAYDPGRDRMVVFGGYDGLFTNDSYELSLGSSPAAWTKLHPTGPLPYIRDFSTSYFDVLRDRLVVFAGNAVPNDHFFPPQGTDDLWALTFSDQPTPALLSLVDEEVGPGTVHLAWYTPDGAGQVATAFRKTDGSDWQAVGDLVSNASGQFVLDDAVSAGGRFDYRLGIRSGSGGFDYTAEHWVTVPIEASFGLWGAHPNPWRGPLSLDFSLAVAGPATLRLYDVRGRLVKSQDVTSFGPGAHTMQMLSGDALAPGVYVLRLAQGAKTAERKIAVVR